MCSVLKKEKEVWYGEVRCGDERGYRKDFIMYPVKGRVVGTTVTHEGKSSLTAPETRLGRVGYDVDQ
jgi:hypothetical protein